MRLEDSASGGFEVNPESKALRRRDNRSTVYYIEKQPKVAERAMDLQNL
jgi:hypothetical protein